MRRKQIFGLILVIVVIVSCATIIYSSLFVYQSSSDLHDFPIPKAAKLTQTNPHAEIYEWSKASEENGIPSSYQAFIKLKGWEEGEREGAAVYYTKEDHIVELITTTNRLTIIY